MSTRASSQRAPRKAAPRKRLSLVEPKQKKSRRRLPWLVIISLALVFTVIFGVLLSRVVLVKTSFKLQKLQERLTAAEELHEELMLETAKKESPARIEREARALGMVDPVTVNYIVADVPRKADQRFASEELSGSVTEGATVAATAEETP
jgi:hypothetical protein